MSSEAASSGRLLGRTLGQFRILEVLGEGGMGVVYRAFDERLRRNVALKVLPEDAIRDETRRRRFLREARSAAAITHANVAAVHDVGEAEGLVYIAMELVEGTTLAEELTRARLLVPEALRIARAIARALAKAHEKGIVHRDLKPENVMIGEDREVKVLDFGLAKLMDREPSSKSLLEIDETAGGATLEGRVIGTPAYMSPEQAMGMPLDARTDVFSFGTVLYEMLTGLRPFHGASPMAIMVAVTRDKQPPPTSVVPTIPEGLARIVDTCLEKEPVKRFPNGRGILAALDAFEAREPSISGPTLDRDPRSGQARSLENVTRPSVRAPPPPKSRAPAFALAAAGVAGILAAAIALRPAPVASTPVVDAGDALLSAPAARVPEAAALFTRSIAREREGRHDLACADATKASDIDVSFATAHLAATLCRRAVPREGRPYFRRAWTEREALSRPDAALLDALEPVYQRDPEDDTEEVRRLRDAVARFPTDARIHVFLARALRHVGQTSDANVEMARSLALDPRQPYALELHADYLAYDGEFERAEEAIDRCLALAPGSLGCLLERAWIAGEHGACDRLEASARRMLTVASDDVDAERALANALYAQGHAVATSRELLRRVASATPDAPNDPAVRLDAIHLAILSGDFAAAVKLAAAMHEAAATSSVATEHALPDAVLADIYRELHRDADASAIAAAYLDGRDAWEPESRFEDWAIANEPTPYFLATRVRAHALTHEQFVAQRAQAVKKWESRVESGSRSFVWIYAYAVPAETAADAADAIAAIPRYAPLPAYTPLSLVDESIGRMYLLAGRPEDALPKLEAAARSCFVVDHPIESTRAHLWLGQAREAKGDKAGACAAYAVVQSRWENAKPRPVTMERAAARIAALKCSP